MNIRIPRTLLATYVPTTNTLRSIGRRKQIAAQVTIASNPLSSRSSNQILTTRARRNRKLPFPNLASRHDRRTVRIPSPGFPLRDSGFHGQLGLLLLLLLLLRGLALERRVTRTLLATGVLTVNADLVGAEGSLAPMTGASNTHANRLVHTLDGHVAGRFPFAGFKSEAIFGEQSPGLFLLKGAPRGNHGRFSCLGIFGRLLLLRGSRSRSRSRSSSSRSCRSRLSGRFSGTGRIS